MPKLNPTIFREYDIRGVAERDFGDENSYLLGRAIGTLQRRAGKRRVAVGRDCRLHSPRIRDAVLRGLLECGLEVTDVRTHAGTAAFGSADELAVTEVQGSPLADRISEATYAAIRAGAREVLAPFTTPDGRLEAPLYGHLVAARTART